MVRFVGFLILAGVLFNLPEVVAQHELRIYSYDQRLRIKIYGPGIKYNGIPEKGFDVDLGSIKIDVTKNKFPFLLKSLVEPLDLTDDQLHEIEVLRSDFKERTIGLVKKAIKTNQRLKKSEKEDLEKKISTLFKENQLVAIQVVMPSQFKKLNQKNFRKEFFNSPHDVLTLTDISKELKLSKSQQNRVQEIEMARTKAITSIKDEQLSKIAERKKISRSKIRKILTADQITKLETILGHELEAIKNE